MAAQDQDGAVMASTGTRCAARQSSSADLGDERLDGAQQSLLIATRELLDLLQAPIEPAVPGAPGLELVSLRPSSSSVLTPRMARDLNHGLGRQTGIVVLVVRHGRLGDAEALGELDLGEPRSRRSRAMRRPRVSWALVPALAAISIAPRSISAGSSVRVLGAIAGVGMVWASGTI